MFMTLIGYWILFGMSMYIYYCKHKQKYVYKDWQPAEFGKQGYYHLSYLTTETEFHWLEFNNLFREHRNLLSLENHQHKLACRCVYIQLNEEIIASVEIVNRKEFEMRRERGFFK